MRAVILAGGRGRRLRPYTAMLPKPLMPVGERPILEIVVEQLRKAGFTHLTVAVGYLAGLIQAYFDRGQRFGVEIDYSLEETPLGTAGPLSLLDPAPHDDFLVMNGDVLTDLDYAAFVRAHRASGAIVTVAVFEKIVDIALGVLDLDERDDVVGYTEKPRLCYPVSTGIYCFRPQALQYLERNAHCDLPQLVMRLVGAGERVHGYRLRGYWLDIGNRDDYELALETWGQS